MKKVGFLGGSFDPVHFGHISLAVEILEKHRLDEVIFCPVFCSPYKQKSPPIASAHHRLQMLKLALDHPKFSLSALELERGEISYTIDTILALQKPCQELRIIVSSETASHLHTWKRGEELMRLAPPLIGARHIPISSTDIRNRLKNKLYCGHLVPYKVLQYIDQNLLYR